MLKIGITGGMGSGKTTVCRVFESLGIPVYYADLKAKALMQSDAQLIAAIQAEFGEQTYDQHQQLNRAYLAEKAFSNAEQTAKLNALVHPAVYHDFEKWAKTWEANKPYVLKEAALLFESDSYKQCDYSILVLADHQVKIERIKARDGLQEEQILARMDKQWSDAQKLEKANFVIHNNENTSILQQVLALHSQFIL